MYVDMLFIMSALSKEGDRSLMAIVIRNRFCDPSSKPDRSCLGTHVIANNSKINNVFFFVSDLEIVYYKNY